MTATNESAPSQTRSTDAAVDMSDAPSDVDKAIEAYTRELAAEAELAKDDLEEIHDHLRLLVDELRAAGVPAGVIVAEARRRLGDPKLVAREHLRVRTPYGTPLSLARTWSAIVILGLALVCFHWRTLATGNVLPHVDIQMFVGPGLLVALALRQTWARAALLGYSAFMLAISTIYVMGFPDSSPLLIPPYLAAITLLAPWHRRDLTLGGSALALQVWAFGCGGVALWFHRMYGHDDVVPDLSMLNMGDSWTSAMSGAECAFYATIAAVLGVLFRGRFGAVVAMLATVAFAFAALDSAHVLSTHVSATARTAIATLVATGAVAMAASSYATWRHARSTLGSPRAVFG